MTRANTAVRLAAGGGGVGLAGAAFVALLREEARWARRKVEARTNKEGPPSGDGVYGQQSRNSRGKPLVLAVLGDSSAVGLGVDRAAETPGVLIAAALAELAERPVRLVCVAVSGAESRELDDQVDRALSERPDVALIMIGANDVTTLTKPAVSVRHLEDAVRRFMAADCEVVVGTCPDLGTVRPIPQPLRQVARQWSRRLAAAQTIAVVEAGGRTVSMGSILGPEFDAAPAVLFGPDRFHPSAAGYASMVGVLLPSVLAALGLGPDSEEHPQPKRGEGLRPIGKAAVHATKNPGTEIDGTEIGGSARGPGGRWVLQMRRRWLNPGSVEGPETGEHDTADHVDGELTDAAPPTG